LEKILLSLAGITVISTILLLQAEPDRDCRTAPIDSLVYEKKDYER
jgi:hypothetical protein